MGHLTRSCTGVRLFAVTALLLLAQSGTAGEPAKKAAAAPPDPFNLAFPVAEADKLLPQDNDYVVHEWGTFTSFSGSDGVALDFRPLVDEDLPKFVIDRQKQAFLCERRDLAYARGKSDKGLVISRQRMETPVTYFYTDRERIVDASVEFPRGLLTEFYPPVRQFAPAYRRGEIEPLENSWLRWGKIRLLPPGRELDPRTGTDVHLRKIEAGENEHYAYARETDSATVQLTDPAMSGTYHEKFLFYRGVGNFDLPVTLRSSGDGRFVLTHSGKTPLHYAFLVEVGTDGRTVRFARFDNILGSADMILPSRAGTIDALAEEVVGALVSDGLYEKEARAMVKTWRASWFGEPGTRVLYSLPQAATDALLPLRLTPAPRQIVRVMVGRLETLPPEREREIESLVSRLGAADPGARDRAAAEIRKLGRFAEPALARVAEVSDEPEIRIRAKSLTREILTGRSAEKR
jgi:hypothetical protein